MVNNIFYAELDKIQLHPITEKVYKTKNLDVLKLTMKMIPQLAAVIVVQRGEFYQIIDGVSRFMVAKELKWKTLKVELLDLPENKIQDQLVIRNLRTKRSIHELCNHAELILGILGKSQGKRRLMLGDSSLNNEMYSCAGKDRFEIACEIIGADMSASSLRRLLEVKEFEEKGDNVIKGFELMEKIEKGEMKIHQAHNVITNYRNSKKEQGSNALTEAMEVVKGKNFKLFNKSCENLNDIPDESIDSTVTSPPYFQQRDYPDGVRDMEQPQHGMERTVDAYVEKEVDINRGVYKKLKNTGSLFIVISDSFRDGKDCLVVEKLTLGMVNAGWSKVQTIHWLKDDVKPQSDLVKRLMPTGEYILHFVKDPKQYYYREFRIWKDEGGFNVKRGSKDCGMGHKMKNHTWWLQKPLVRFRNFLSEQQIKNLLHTNGFNWTELKDIDPSFRHMAPYPSVIPLLPILLTTKIGDTVLDIYNGTSTTTAVALQLGRKVIGYDTDTVSHEFASKRLGMVEENLPTNQEVLDFENEFIKNNDEQDKMAA